jgi:hypothetical protein
MKRTLVVVLSVITLLIAADAKPKPKKQLKPPCAANIGACPVEGCSPDNHHDPNLNRVKNIRTNNQAIQDHSLTWMKNLNDPENFTEGGNRDELAGLGEGDKVRVVAYLLIARDEPSGESCNCYLHSIEETDNHLVLVTKTTVDTFPVPMNANKAALKATLGQREMESETAEFTPRVRQNGHPNFLSATVQPLIDATLQKALRVRVTGQLMFDSEHFIRHHLHRVNNWEIHPVLKMEFCTTGNSCKANSDAGWKSIED